MEMSTFVMWVGFMLASFSVVGNDVIQTLGTFLTSNEKKLKWYVLYAFAATIMVAALVNGYMQSDIHYGRLDKYLPELTVDLYKWYYLIPPFVLLFITRIGIPVSTTFMILTLFSLNKVPNDIGSLIASIFDSSTKMGGMINKSLLGYLVAFASAIAIYLAISKLTEKKFKENPIKTENYKFWAVAQWLTTGFLWFQWLTQDLANIYVYLQGGQNMSPLQFLFSLIILLGLLALIFYRRGGNVQEVVRRKYNTADIRSATFIDLIYAIILYVFKYDSLFGLEYQFPWTGNLPMSTTWVFIGLLAGREIGIRLITDKGLKKETLREVLSDLGKVSLGLIVSVVLVIIIKLLST